MMENNREIKEYRNCLVVKYNNRIDAMKDLEAYITAVDCYVLHIEYADGTEYEYDSFSDKSKIDIERVQQYYILAKECSHCQVYGDCESKALNRIDHEIDTNNTRRHTETYKGHILEIYEEMIDVKRILYDYCAKLGIDFDDVVHLEYDDNTVIDLTWWQPIEILQNIKYDGLVHVEISDELVTIVCGDVEKAKGRIDREVWRRGENEKRTFCNVQTGKSITVTYITREKMLTFLAANPKIERESDCINILYRNNINEHIEYNSQDDVVIRLKDIISVTYYCNGNYYVYGSVMVYNNMSVYPMEEGDMFLSPLGTDIVEDTEEKN